MPSGPKPPQPRRRQVTVDLSRVGWKALLAHIGSIVPPIVLKPLAAPNPSPTLAAGVATATGLEIEYSYDPGQQQLTFECISIPEWATCQLIYLRVLEAIEKTDPASLQRGRGIGIGLER